VPVQSSSTTAVVENIGPAELDGGQVRSLADALAVVPDPRSPLGRWHPLTSIMLIAACATTCDANGLTAMWQWVDDADQQVLARLQVRVDPLTGRRRPPSERTIRRVLARVDPQAVQDAAGAFVAGRLQAAGLRMPPVREREQRRAQRAEASRPPGRPERGGVAFDGKTLRGARRAHGRRLGLLAGVEHGSGRVLAQRAIDTKTNEIPELRTLLGTGLDLTGRVATADAAHCQHATAQAVIAAGGDYLLVLKANQAGLLEQVAPLLAGPDADWAEHRHDSTDRGHGRTEQRSVRVAAATGIAFPGAAQVFRTVRRSGGLDGQRTGKQVVYGITSLTDQRASPAQIAAYQRGHWGIENRTHYVRDLTFAEDHCQARTGHGPQNLAAFRNLAIDTFRAAGYVNIAHARRHHTHHYTRVLDLYGL
jgi:predicted transposase YbfD/YdcC